MTARADELTGSVPAGDQACIPSSAHSQHSYNHSEHHDGHGSSSGHCSSAEQTCIPTPLPGCELGSLAGSSPSTPSGDSGSSTGSAATTTTAASTLPAVLSLDLSTGQQTLAAINTAPITIQVGGTVGTDGLVSGGTSYLIDPGQMLTPAQYLTVMGLLAGSGQTLVLDTQGSAIGGSLRIDAGSISTLSSLTIPTNVSLASIGFGDSNPLTVSGNALIQGSMYALQSSPGTGSFLNFNSLTIDPGGILSGIMPGSMAGYASMASVFSSNGLAINVVQDIVNNGTISTIGDLTMTAGGSIFNNGGIITNVASIIDSSMASVANLQSLTSIQNINLFMGSGVLNNSGLIAAVDNLNIQSELGQNLQILNEGGVLEALSAINIRDSFYTGSADLSLSGGSVISQELNLYSGTGVINANLNAISGTLSTYAGEAHVMTNSDMLSLGNICISGDPTYYNTGNIQLTGDILVSEKLAIVAGGNITATAGLTRISTTDGGGQGYDIQIIAGANVSPACGTCYPSLSGSPASSGSITIDPTTPNGGNIDLSGASSVLAIQANSITSGLSGGNITMVAFANGANTGWIRLPATTTINTSGSGSGNNGNFTAIAGGTNTITGNSIQLGNIVAGGGTGNAPNTGQVSITTIQPTTSDGAPLVFDANANVISIDGSTLLPNYFTPDPFSSPTSGGVSVGNITTQGQSINITSGNAITAGTLNTSGLNGGSVNLVADGNINIISGIQTSASAGNGGSINITSLGSITSGPLNSSSSSLGNGGNITLDSATNTFNLSSISTFSTFSAAGVLTFQNNGSIIAQPTVSFVSGSSIVIAGNTTGSSQSLYVNLANSNPLGTISTLNSGAGSGGNITLISPGALTITRVLSAGGSVNLLANGNINIVTEVQTSASAGNGGSINITSSGSITSGILDSSSSSLGAGGNITLDSATSTFNLNSIRTFSASSAAGVLTFQNNGSVIAQPTVSFASGSNILISSNTPGSSPSLYINLANSNPLGTISTGNAGTGSGGNITLISPGALTITYANSSGGLSGGSVNLLANGDINITAGIQTSASAGNGGSINITSPGSITSGSLLSYSSASGAGGNITLDSATSTFNLSSIQTYSLSGAAGILTFQNNGSVIAQPTVSFVSGSNIYINSNTPGSSQSLYINLASSNPLGGIRTYNVGTGSGGNITLISPGALTVVQVVSFGGLSGGSVNLLANGDINITAGIQTSASAGNGGSINITSPGSITSGSLLSYSSASGAGGNITLDSATSTFNLSSIQTSSTSGAAGILTFQSNGSVIAQPTVSFVSGSNIYINSNTPGSSQSLYINLASSNPLGGIRTYNVGTGSGGNITLISPGALTVVQVVSFGGLSGGSVNLLADGNINITSSIQTSASAGNGGSINITSPGSITSGSLLSYSSASGAGGNITLDATSLDLTGTVNTGNGIVTFRPTNNGNISVGGISSSSPFFISDSVLSSITASTLAIGSFSFTGTFSLGNSLNVSGPANTPGRYNLVFNTGGDYTDNGYSITLGARSLSVNAGTTANTGAITATSGNIEFTTGSTLTANNSVTTSAGNIIFAAPSVNINSGVSISGLTVSMMPSVVNDSINLLNNGTITGGNSVNIQAPNGSVSLPAGSTGQISVSNNNAFILIGGAGTDTVNINPAQSFTASGTSSAINIESVNSTTFGNTVTFNTGANSTVSIMSTGGTVNLNSPVIFNGTGGSTFNLSGDSVTANNITASGQSLNITSASAITTGALNTSSASVAGGNIILDSATGTFNLGHIWTFSPVAASGSLNFRNNGTPIAQPTVTFTPGSSILVYGNTTGAIQSLSFNLAVANNLGNIYAYNLGTGTGGSVTLVSPGTITTGTIDTSASGGGGNITLDSTTSEFSLGSINTSSNNSTPGQLVFQNTGAGIVLPTVTFAPGAVIYTYGRTSNPIQSISINLANSNLLNGIRTFNLGSGAGGSVTIISPGTLSIAEILTHGQGGGGSIVLDSATSSFSLGSIFAYSSNSAPGSLTFQNNGTVLSQPTVTFVPGSNIQLHGNTGGAIQSLSINLGGASSFGNIYTYNTGSGSGGSITFISPGSFSANLISTFGAAGAGAVSVTANDFLTINSITTTSISGNGGGINLISNTSSVISGALNSFATGNGGDIIIDTAAVNLSSTINAGTGRVILRPNQNGDVTIGGVSSSSPFFVSDTVLSSITAETLEIGSSTYTGTLSLGNSLNTSGVTGNPGVYNLVFNTGGNYTDAGNAIALGSRSLSVNAGNTANTGLITATTGNINFTAGAGITANNNVSTSGGSITFAAPTVTVNSGVIISAPAIEITPAVTNGSVSLSNRGIITAGNLFSMYAPNGTVSILAGSSGQISVSNNNASLLIGSPTTNSVVINGAQTFSANGNNSSISIMSIDNMSMGNAITFNTGSSSTASIESTNGFVNLTGLVTLNSTTGSSLNITGNGVTAANIGASGQEINITSVGDITTGALNTSSASVAGGNITLDSSTATFNLGSMYTFSGPVYTFPLLVGVAAPGSLTFRNNGVQIAQPTVNFASGSNIWIYGNTPADIQPFAITLANSNPLGHILAYNIGSGAGGSVTITSPGTLTVFAIETQSTGGGNGGDITLNAVGDINLNWMTHAYSSAGNGHGGDIRITAGGAIAASVLDSQSTGPGGTGGNIILDSATSTFNLSAIYTSSDSSAPGNLVFQNNGAVISQPTVSFSSFPVLFLQGNTSADIQPLYINFSNGGPGSMYLEVNIRTDNAGSGAGGAVTLVAPGELFVADISTNGGSSGGDVSLTAASDITIFNINAGSGAVMLGAGSAGNIAQVGSNQIATTSSLTMTSGSGFIGQDTARINTSAPNLVVNTTGNVYVTSSSAVTVTGASSGGIFSLTSTAPDSAITVNDSIIATSGIELNTNRLNLDSGSSVTAQGGNVVVNTLGADNNLVITAPAGSSALISNEGGGNVIFNSHGSVNLQSSVSNTAGTLNISLTSNRTAVFNTDIDSSGNDGNFVNASDFNLNITGMGRNNLAITMPSGAFVNSGQINSTGDMNISLTSGNFTNNAGATITATVLSDIFYKQIRIVSTNDMNIENEGGMHIFGNNSHIVFEAPSLITVSGHGSYTTGGASQLRFTTTGNGDTNITFNPGAGITLNTGQVTLSHSGAAGNLNINLPAGSLPINALVINIDANNGDTININGTSSSTLDADAVAIRFRVWDGELNIASNVAVNSSGSITFYKQGESTINNFGTVSGQAGVYFDLGGTDTLTVNNSGSILAGSGNIEAYTWGASGQLNMNNSGTIRTDTGNIVLNTLSEQLTLNNSGTVRSIDGDIYLNSTNSIDLSNSGVITAGNSVSIQAPGGTVLLQSASTGQISATNDNAALVIGGAGTTAVTINSLHSLSATGDNSSIRLEATGTVDLNQSLTFNTGANGQVIFSSTAGILNANASNVFNAGTNTSILFNGQNGVNFAAGTTQSNPNGSLSATAASGSIAVNSNATLQSINGNLSLSNSGGSVDISEGATLRAATSLPAGGATDIMLSGASGVNISSAGAAGTTTIMAGTLTGGADPNSTDINAYDLSAVSSTGAITINSANGSVVIGDNVNITSIAANINVNAGQDFTVGQGNAIIAQGGNIGINAVNNLSLGVNGGAFTSMQAIARYNPNLAPFIIDGETIPAYQGSGIGIYVGSVPINWDVELPAMELNRVKGGYVNVSGMPGGDCPTCSAPNGGQLEILVTGSKTITANNVSAIADGGVIWIDPPDMFLNNISFFAAGPGLAPPPPVPPAPPAPGGGTAAPPVVSPVIPPVTPSSPVITAALPSTYLASTAVPTDVTRHFSIPLSTQNDSNSQINRISADTRVGTYYVANDTCQPFYFDDDSTMMVGAGGTAFSPVDKHSIHIEHGRMIAMVGKSNVNITTSMASVELKANSAAIVEQKENGTLRVTNLSGNNTDITVNREGKPQTVSVASGEEIILANEDLSEEELIPVDGIERDQMQRSTVIAGTVMIKSRPNRQQLFEKDMLLLCSDGSFFKVKKRIDAVRRSIDPSTSQSSAPSSPSSGKSSDFGSTPKLLKSSLSESFIIKPSHSASSQQATFLPVAHISTTSAGMQSRISSLTTDGALIKHNGKAMLELHGANSLKLKSGSAIVSTTQPTVIHTAHARVEVAANTIAMVSCHNDVLSVRNFWDTKSNAVKVIAGKHYVLVPAGQEIVIASSDEAMDKALAADGITRRLAHRVDIPGQGGRLHACEFSFVSLIQQSDFLNHLMMSNNPDDKLLSNKLLKMATCLSQVTAKHGRYSSFQPNQK